MVSEMKANSKEKVYISLEFSHRKFQERNCLLSNSNCLPEEQIVRRDRKSKKRHLEAPLTMLTTGSVSGY
jgi:uncharacterized protein YpiB (UPF0302 family)